MKSIAYLLLCSALTLQDVMAGQIKDFSDIPLAEASGTSAAGNQTITMNLQRAKQYKDIVND